MSIRLNHFFIVGTPIAALTGTADDTTMKNIVKQLVLRDPEIIRLSPNRENIRLSVIKTEKDNILSKLDWLIDSLISEGVSTPKTIIFCNTMNDIACVSNYLMLKLGTAAYFPKESRECSDCLIGLYHSSSWEQNKNRVVQSLKNESKLRVVIASTALSMGVNFPNIKYIVNYGPARNLIDQHQEFGRAGRDGSQSHALILYHGYQLSPCEQTVKDFVKTNECLRVAAYKPFDARIEPLIPLHNCCCYCSKLCRCHGENCNEEPPLFEKNISSNNDSDPKFTRPVTQEDKNDLREALLEVQERKSKGNVLFDSVHGFSSQLIDDVVTNCSRLFTVNDVIDTCPVFSLNDVLIILELIQEMFLDIPNFDECMDILRQTDLTSNMTSCLEDSLQCIDFGLTDEYFSDSDDELLEVLTR